MSVHYLNSAPRPRADTRPGTVADLHELLEARFAAPEVDAGEWLRSRIAEREAARPSALRIALAILASVLAAHVTVAAAEGSPWPGEWGVNASLAAICAAFAFGLLFAAFATKEG